MDKSQIRQQVIGLNEKISSRINEWKNSIDDMPQIEIDFLKEKLRMLYDCFCELEKKENKGAFYAATKEELVMQPETMMAKAIAMNTEKSEEIKKEVESNGVPDSEIKPVFEEISQPLGGRQRVKKPATVAAMYDEIKVVGEMFEGQPTVHDRISKDKKDESVASRFERKSIPDLKKSIGLNERFLFINSLFHGDSVQYATAITKIEEGGNLDTARQVLSEIASANHWENDNKEYRNFLSLIERRFTS